MRLKRPDGLNIVPFIDVMLVLLAIVLTISTFIAQGKIQVDLPSSSSSYVDRKDIKSFEIIIDNDNKIYANNKEVNLQNLKELLLDIDNKDEVVVAGDFKSDFGSFIEIVDILKSKGHENLQIITKHEKK